MSPYFIACMAVLRLVLLLFAASRVGLALTGQARGAGEYGAALGGLLYVVGVLGDYRGWPDMGGWDLDLLTRTAGLALTVLPLTLRYLFPTLYRRARERRTKGN